MSRQPSVTAVRKFFFETCVAMKFLDDDDVDTVLGAKQLLLHILHNEETICKLQKLNIRQYIDNGYTVLGGCVVDADDAASAWLILTGCCMHHSLFLIVGGVKGEATACVGHTKIHTAYQNCSVLYCLLKLCTVISTLR